METIVCIHLKHMNGDEATFEDISSNMSIRDFKKIVSEKMKYELSTIKLIFKGRILSDEKNIGDYGLLEKTNMIVIGSGVVTPSEPILPDPPSAPVAPPNMNDLIRYDISGRVGIFSYDISLMFPRDRFTADEVNTEIIDFFRRLYNLHPSDVPNPANEMQIPHVDLIDHHVERYVEHPPIMMNQLFDMMRHPVEQNMSEHLPEENNLTAEDNEKIDRLVMLFREIAPDISRNIIIQKYLVCGRNVDTTADELMFLLGR